MSGAWQRQVGNSVVMETIMTSSRQLYLAVTTMHRGERITRWSQVVEAVDFGSGLLWDASEAMADQIMVAAVLACEEAEKS